MSQTRRDFLKGLGAMTGLALAGPVLNGCASLEERLKENSPFKKRKYDTIAHSFLDIEAEFGVTDSDYQVLDNLIDAVKEKIEIKPKYTPEEAVAILITIGKILKDKGFTYQENILFNKCLKTKKLDCNDYSILYLGIADVLKLPLKAIITPKHVSIRWDQDDTYFNWETTNKQEKKVCYDDYYTSREKIPEISIEKGVYLKSLSREETYSIAYENIGTALLFSKKYKEAIKTADKAIGLNSLSVPAHGIKGDSLYYLKKYGEAIACYDKILELHPWHALALRRRKQAVRSKAFKDLEKLLENKKFWRDPFPLR